MVDDGDDDDDDNDDEGSFPLLPFPYYSVRQTRRPLPANYL